MRPTVPLAPAAVRMILAVPIAAAFALTGSASASGAPMPGSVPPDQDPFYAAPAGIASYAPGQIVATRKFTPKSGPSASSVDAWQISYRTNDSHGQPDLAVTSPLVPTKAWTGTASPPPLSVH